MKDQEGGRDDSEEEAERKNIFPLFCFYDLRDGQARLKKWPIKVTIAADIWPKIAPADPLKASPAKTKSTKNCTSVKKDL